MYLDMKQIYPMICIRHETDLSYDISRHETDLSYDVSEAKAGDQFVLISLGTKFHEIDF